MRPNSFGSRGILPSLLLLALLVPGCAAVRNPALEQARDSYQKARQDPVLVRNAGASLARAGLTLEAADRLWNEEQDVTEVEHLAYIVEKRIEIARQVAQRRMAVDEIQQAESPASR
jgi:OmpA-OmpF porin, OOP family